MKYTLCSTCSLYFLSENPSCPVCDSGFEHIHRARISCTNCDTTVGEALYQDKSFELVSFCEYCNPSPNATDFDIVSRLTCVLVSNGEARRVAYSYTRAEARKSREQKRVFIKALEEISGKNLASREEALYRVL